MEFKQQYQEVFSQVRPAADFDPEEFIVQKKRNSIPKKIVLIAAVTALLAGFSLVAYATDIFGLRAALLPQQHEVRLPIDPAEQPEGETAPDMPPKQETQMVDVISLVGFADTPEARATAEWQAFLSTYDQDEAILRAIGNSPTGFEEKYGPYLVYTQEMADKLDEITAKYGLKLHTTFVDLFPSEKLCAQVGGDFLGENWTGSAYMYEDGTFHFDGEIDLEGYGHLDYQFMRAVRGSFTDTLLNIRAVDDYTEWAYTTRDGVNLTLALSPHKGLIIADLPDSFVTVNVLAGTETPFGGIFSNGPFDAAALERLADSFTFSLLTPALPASAEAIDLAAQQKAELEEASRFYTATGMEMWQAQAFYAELIGHIENDRRQAVAEMLIYPTKVTFWSTTAAGPHQVYEIAESPQEFLPLYDKIFTEDLWQSCIITNQYDRERADLFTADGMVGAAGGAIWFGMTDSGIGVFTVQNQEDCRLSHLEAESMPTPPSVADTCYDSAKTAYAAALNTLLYEHVFPDGQLYEPFPDGTGDRFALADLHGDGTEELILLATNSYTAGQAGYVLSWEEETGTTRVELWEHPRFTFWDNGYLQAWAAHNQGKAGDVLWPYTLYCYDEESGTYQSVAMVDAWDRALGETYYGMTFPAETDVSGTGVVYYIMSPASYDLSTPLDAADFGGWEQWWQGEGRPIEMGWQELTADNLFAFANS